MAFVLPGADQIPFHHLSVEDGLSQVTVNDITQDELGFMWFATEDGLNRYDGKKFVQYRSDATKANKVSGNIINFVFLDSKNRLWAGTNGQGVDVKINNRFNNVAVYINQHKKNNIIASVIFEDSSHTIWLGSWGDGLFKYSEKERRFLSVDPVSEIKKLWAITEFENRILIGADSNGIAEVRESRIIPWKNTVELAKTSIKALFVYGNKLLIGTDGKGLFEYSSKLEKIGKVPLGEGLENLVVHKFYTDQKSILWIGTLGSGFFRYGKDKKWTHQIAGNEKESLSNNRVFSIFQDKSGVLWVGTEGGGLNYYDPYSILFRNIRQGSDSHKNLNDKMVYAITSDERGDWWIGTESGGVNRWDVKEKKFHYYTKQTGHLLHNNVRALINSPKGIFVGTMNGFSLISKKGKLIHQWNKDSLSQLPDNIILSFEKGAGNSLWIGTYKGLIQFNYKTGKVMQSFMEKDNGGPFVHGIIISIKWLEDKLWVGTFSDGLYVYQPSKKTWSKYVHDKKNNASIGSDALETIYIDQQHVVWIGTNGRGIQKFDQNKRTFEQIDKHSGLANNVIYAMLSDNNHVLWLSTNAGLSSYNTTTARIKNYSMSDGLQGREFNVGAAHKRKNILAFGGIQGISWFDSSQNQSNPFKPETQITHVRVLNREITELKDEGIELKQAKGLPHSLILDHDNSMFTLEFAALHFSSPRHNRFRYRLLGLDSKWIESVDNQSEATFTGLAPGQYQFQVVAISKDGLADSSPASMSITLLPPFWKTWWAYSLYVLLTLIIIWRYQAFLKRKLQIQQNLNQGLVKINDLKERLAKTEKMAILGELSSNVAHSLRNPLASIRTSAELLEDDQSLPQYAKADAKNIISEVDRLSTWIKELLAYSKKQSSNIQPLEIISRCQEIIHSYAAKFRTHQINCHIHFELSKAEINMDAILFQHMLHSLLDNAIEALDKEGEIRLSVSKQEENSIVLTIEDNGCGIDFKKQTQIFNDSFSTKPNGLGMGLSLVKRIVERHDATIEVTSEENVGTKFILTFNLIQE